MNDARVSFDAIWDSPRCEPEKRMVGGEFKHATHRFPIKGGVSFRKITTTALIENIQSNNSILKALKCRSQSR